MAPIIYLAYNLLASFLCNMHQVVSEQYNITLFWMGSSPGSQAVLCVIFSRSPQDRLIVSADARLRNPHLAVSASVNTIQML